MRTISVEPEDRYVAGDGLRLHYLDWGGEGKPWLLLLHGGSQTAHTWDFFADALRDEYHVIAPDQRGHGDSGWSPGQDYSREAALADLERLVRETGMDRPGFYLMGMSMGGLVSMVLAASRPEWVKGLVIVDIGPETRPRDGRRARKYGSRLQEGEFAEFEAEARQIYRRSRPEHRQRSLRFELKELPDGRWTWKADPRRYEGGRRVVRDLGELWQSLEAVRCPTLILRGEISSMLADETARRMQSLVPGSRYEVVPGAGHNIQGDKPEALEAAVRAFLADAGR
ncbi:MAG: alpha/beta hydrolase [Dehalococcoidia bacterium]